MRPPAAIPVLTHPEPQEPPARRYPPPQSVVVILCGVFRILLWVLTFIVASCNGLQMSGMIGRASSAFQETSAATMSGAFLIGVYVVAFSIDRILSIASKLAAPKKD